MWRKVCETLYQNPVLQKPDLCQIGSWKLDVVPAIFQN